MRYYGENALLTDLYEITMLQAYFFRRMNDTAVFELFVRELPRERNFLVAAGLEQVVGYLSGLRFSEDDLHWLRESGRFDLSFIESLEDFHFTGALDAMPEGTAFFGNEPLVRICAPLREAQFVESRVINLLHYQTMVASKAARSVIAAEGRRLIDFGLRRAHGAEAALLGARASYIAGFDGTATSLAAPLFGMPVFGTMAHSFIQAHESETDAFISFARAFPDAAVLLIDTYDSEAAAHQVVHVARRLAAEEGIHIRAVRIDSGDLGAVARQVRNILDQGACGDIKIFASGNLDEYAVRDLVCGNAPIDGFGVGTRLCTSSDAPYLDCAYKLVEYAGKPRRKRSSGKATWPGRKQVFRRRDAGGTLCGDTIALNDEKAEGEPLLRPIMRSGRLIGPLPSLEQHRALARSQIDALPAGLRTLQPAPPFAVGVSDSLLELARRTDEFQRRRAEADRAQWDTRPG